jgi:hypothetical protein
MVGTFLLSSMATLLSISSHTWRDSILGQGQVYGLRVKQEVTTTYVWCIYLGAGPFLVSRMRSGGSSKMGARHSCAQEEMNEKF